MMDAGHQAQMQGRSQAAVHHHVDKQQASLQVLSSSSYLMRQSESLKVCYLIRKSL